MVRPSPCVANWHQSDAALSFHVPRSICGKARSHLSRMMAQHCNAPAVPHLITTRRLQKKSDKASDAQTTNLCNSATQHISPSVPPI